MSIAQILISLIMVGLAVSLVFVYLEVENMRSKISRLEAEVRDQRRDASILASRLTRLVNLHQPQVDAQEQAERDLEESLKRYFNEMPRKRGKTIVLVEERTTPCE